MTDAPQGPGWWQAGDGRWYPPQPTPPPGRAPASPTPPPGTPLPPPGTLLPPSAPTPPPGAYGPTTAPPPSGAYGPTTAPPSGSFGPTTAPPPPPGGFGPTTAPPPSGFPGAPAAGKKGNGPLYAVLALIAFVAIAGTAVFFVVTSGGDDPDPTEPDGPVAGSLRLVPADGAGPDPFSTTSFIGEGASGLSNAALDAAASTRDSLGPDDAGALVAVGSLAGLHGGSRSGPVCDAVGLADDLEGDVARAGAFTGVLGVAAAGARDYIQALTPVVLVSDTWVTAHGLANGRAEPYQAVLQAGTAVLVDDRGVPRARCADGGPLTAPTRQDRSTEATTGTEWDGYDPGEVVVVEAGDPVSTFTLVDVETGEEFDRAPGAGQSGAVQVTLQWSTGADLDLHVFDPDGAEVYFNSGDDPDGGTLDVDVIPGCDGSDDLHTENVFWPEGAAPSGTYRIEVVNYSGCDAPRVEFTVQAYVDGVLVLDESATVAEDGTNDDFTFER